MQFPDEHDSATSVIYLAGELIGQIWNNYDNNCLEIYSLMPRQKMPSSPSCCILAVSGGNFPASIWRWLGVVARPFIFGDIASSSALTHYKVRILHYGL
jgi:hypothetical protein